MPNTVFENNLQLGNIAPNFKADTTETQIATQWCQLKLDLVEIRLRKQEGCSTSIDSLCHEKSLKLTPLGGNLGQGFHGVLTRFNPEYSASKAPISGCVQIKGSGLNGIQ